VNWSATRFQASWMAVVTNNTLDIFNPTGGTSQIDAFMLLGIHSTNIDEFLLTICIIWSSTSCSTCYHGTSWRK
jgi:hypothetical protein